MMNLPLLMRQLGPHIYNGLALMGGVLVLMHFSSNHPPQLTEGITIIILGTALSML